MPDSRPDIRVLANPRSGTSLRNPGAVDRSMKVFGVRAELHPFSSDPADEPARAGQDAFASLWPLLGTGQSPGSLMRWQAPRPPLRCYRFLAHLASLRTTLRFQAPHRMGIYQDLTRHRIRTPMLFVARSTYQFDQFGLEGADAVSDDRFAVFLAHQQTRLGFLRLAWRLIRKKVDHGRDVIVSTPRRLAVAIRGRRRVAVALDGEKLKMRLPLRIHLNDHALRVILPPDKADTLG